MCRPSFRGAWGKEGWGKGRGAQLLDGSGELRLESRGERNSTSTGKELVFPIVMAECNLGLTFSE